MYFFITKTNAKFNTSSFDFMDLHLITSLLDSNCCPRNLPKDLLYTRHNYMHFFQEFQQFSRIKQSQVWPYIKKQSLIFREPCYILMSCGLKLANLALISLKYCDFMPFFFKKHLCRIHSHVFLVAKWQNFTHVSTHIKMFYEYCASIQQWCGK